MLAGGTQEQRDFLASLAPMKRIADPAEIARGIVYLNRSEFPGGSNLQAEWSHDEQADEQIQS